MARFWRFAQLSDKYSTLKSMDCVTRFNGKLYIGGLRAIDEPDVLKEAEISHVLSALEVDYCEEYDLREYKRLLVQVEDNAEENILVHFGRTNAFLEDALTQGGNVLVHCAMGISRSTTIVCAFMMYEARISPSQALEKTQETRPLCSPNQGFPGAA